MRLLFLGLILVLPMNAVAGIIVPDIKWNEVDFNETGVAASKSSRNSFGLLRLTSENKNTDSKKITDKGTSTYLVGTLSGDWGGLEIAGGSSEAEYLDGPDDEGKFLIFNAGKRVGKISFGLDGYHVDYENFNTYKTGFSSSFQVNDLILIGGGVNRRYINSFEFGYLDYYLGIGFTKKDFFAFEAVLKYQPDDKKTTDGLTYRIDEETGVKLQGSINLGRFQISPTFETLTSEEEDGGRVSLTELGVESEFRINDSFFVGALLKSNVRSYEDADLDDNDDTYLVASSGVSLRYRHHERFQIYGKYESGTAIQEYNDGTDDDKETQKSMSLIGSYFF